MYLFAIKRLKFCKTLTNIISFMFRLTCCLKILQLNVLKEIIVVVNDVNKGYFLIKMYFKYFTKLKITNSLLSIFIQNFFM